MIETIEFKGEVYPAFQASGNAARFITPFALEVCKGMGLDIGYNKPEWKLPNATGIDDGRICDPDGTEHISVGIGALHIPDKIRIDRSIQWDYVFSSHCLEHLNDWVAVLDYWYNKLKYGGVLLLYLPHPDQKYWAPFVNRKHVSILHPEDIEAYLKDKGYKKIFVSGRDLNHSYCVMAEK